MLGFVAAHKTSNIPPEKLWVYSSETCKANTYSGYLKSPACSIMVQILATMQYKLPLLYYDLREWGLGP